MIEDIERTPDPSDIATRQEELARMSAMVSSRKQAGPAPTGFCLHCGEPVDANCRWCDAECRDGWEREHKR